MSGAKKSGGFAAALAGLDNLGQVSKEGNDIGLGTRLAADPSDAVPMIEVALIDADPEQPRQAFDPDKLRELADSIAEQGLIQPIVLRRNPTRPGRFLIVAGERRWRAVQLIGSTTIGAVVKELQHPEVAALVENVQRENLTAAETARAISKQLKLPNLNATKLAKMLGWPLSRVSEYAAVAKMPPGFAAALDAGTVNDIRTLNDAAALAKTYPEEVTKLVTGASQENPLTRAKVRQLNARLAGESARPKGGGKSKGAGQGGDDGQDNDGDTSSKDVGDSAKAQLYARVFVSDGEAEIGYLDLEKPGAKDGKVFVVRDGGVSTLEPLADLRLSRVAFL